MTAVSPNLKPGRNLVYDELPSQQLLLDLYRPDTDRIVPVVVYFHSGGWHSGSKDHCQLQWLTRYGLAVASVGYRLLPVHRFPVQVQDAKTAVRFLRAHADDFGLDRERFAAAGMSAGAYLACMLGLTHGHAVLDAPPARTQADMSHPGLPGSRADYSAQSTKVHAVVNYGALVDFPAIQGLASRRGRRAERSPEGRLLGHAVAADPDRARLASPMYHIHSDAPPFLHLHGDVNEVTPIDQTRKFHAALQEAGVHSKVNLIKGAKHNSPRLVDDPSIRDRVADFLHRHLQTEGGMRAVTEDLAARRAADRES